MALIQSGATTDLLTVDPTSKAARVTIYDPNGNLADASHPSNKILQTNATITASGNTLFTNVDSSSVTLFINIEANPTGTSPTLTYTVAEVDPTDQATVVGQTITGSALNSITTQQLTISMIKSNTIRVSWVLGGSSSPTFTQVNSIIVGQSAGSITANIGMTGGLALDATLTSGNLKAQMYDGTNVIGTNAHPVRVDPTGTTTQPVSGTITANAGTGTFTVGGTVTANVGTTNGLALDTTVSGLQVAQGSSSSGQKGELIQGAATTSAPSYTTGTTNPLSLTTSGALRIDGSGATQPVSGTITANQGGTWTVQPGNTANTTPWLATINQGGNSVTVTGANALKVDGSGSTQPVSGTITANAGSGTFTVSGTVTSNIGTTNGLALDASVTGLQVSQGSTTSGQKGGLTQGAVTTSAPSYTTGQTSPLSLTTSGALRTDSSTTTQPISGTITANVGTTGGLALDATLTGGTAKTQMFDGTNVIGTSSHPVKIDPTGTTTQPVSGTVTANAGTGTFTVGGTVTANIGTSGSLALDTSVNGILVSQGSTTSGEKGPLIQGAVTTSAPSYTTAQTSPLSLTTVGNLRVDGSSVTQPVSGTITANIGTTNGLALDATLTGGTQQTKITDGTNIATVKAASTAPAAADKALVVSVSPNSIAATDRASITAGTQQAAVVAGIDGFSTARIARVGEYGTQRTTSEILLWHDALEGSTVNAFWTQSTTTMTIAQATGVLTLNNSNITTVNTDAIITSIRQFPKYPRNPLYARFRANITANVASNHTLVEMGFGAPSGITATINNGAFFRWRVDGTLAAVVSYNGTEKVTQVLAQGVINTSNYYYYDIVIDDDFARFLVSDAAGIPIVDTQVSLNLSTAFTLSVSHIPSFARVYVDATGGGTAIKCLISAHTVQMLDGQMPKPWEQQLASCMRQASINPTTYASTPNLANGAAPTTTTPSNTASAYTTLGGEYACAATAASENILSIFGFTIPSPYTFYLRGLFIPPPAVVGAAIATVPLIQWFTAPNASSTNLSTATGLQRIPLPGMMNTVSASAVSTLFQGSACNWIPQVPIACLPGTVLHIGYKVIAGAATSSLVYRGSVYVDGFFE